MTRTIDHILACHQHANALRRAGKHIWTYTINLQSILDAARSQDSAEQVAVLATQLAAELRRLPVKFFDPTSDECAYDFLDAIDALDSMTAQGLALECEDSGDQPADVLDGWLQEIYNWCDGQRVWTRG